MLSLVISEAGFGGSAVVLVAMMLAFLKMTPSALGRIKLVINTVLGLGLLLLLWSLGAAVHQTGFPIVWIPVGLAIAAELAYHALQQILPGNSRQWIAVLPTLAAFVTIVALTQDLDVGAAMLFSLLLASFRSAL